jgi:hypothetical protein
MSLKNLYLAFELIEEMGGDFAGSKSDKLIQKAQEALGVNFPVSYTTFLKKYGCGSVNGIEIYGVIDDSFFDSCVPDAIWVTLEQRKFGLPDYYVVVYNTGFGSLFSINTSILNEFGESPVVSFNEDGEDEIIANDFGTFLLNELKTVMD